LDGDIVVAIDGKTRRRSTTKAEAKPLRLVSAFAADIGRVLGQTASAEKSSETRLKYGCHFVVTPSPSKQNTLHPESAGC